MYTAETRRVRRRICSRAFASERVVTAPMKFRPCIDVHCGLVKQIVGSTLTESGENAAETNFVATQPPSYFAELYKKDKLKGGHIIMLGGSGEVECMEALKVYPRGMQIGGGIDIHNAHKFLEAGASHVIVTSYVFHDGTIDFARLDALVASIGKERLVLDLSCRRRNDAPPDDTHYYVVTNKWTKYTDFALTPKNLETLCGYCDEFLVHGVDVEGRRCGIEEDLVTLLGEHCSIPVCYAGGVRDMADLERVRELGRGKVDCTVGSALDIFGGSVAYSEVVQWSDGQL